MWATSWCGSWRQRHSRSEGEGRLIIDADAPAGLELRTDDNLVGLVHTDVVDVRLVIGIGPAEGPLLDACLARLPGLTAGGATPRPHAGRAPLSRRACRAASSRESSNAGG
jgi:hypothetical protein